MSQTTMFTLWGKYQEIEYFPKNRENVKKTLKLDVTQNLT